MTAIAPFNSPQGQTSNPKFSESDKRTILHTLHAQSSGQIPAEWQTPSEELMGFTAALDTPAYG